MPGSAAVVMIVNVVSHAAGSPSGSAAVAPELVETGEGDGGAVGAVDEEGLLARLALGVDGGRRDLPLVPAVGRDEAAPRERGLGEGALAEHRLGAGVGHAQPHLDVLGPGRHEAPGEEPELAERAASSPCVVGPRRAAAGSARPAPAWTGAMFQSGSPAGGLWGFLSTLRAGSPVWSSLDVEGLDELVGPRARGIPPAHEPQRMPGPTTRRLRVTTATARGRRRRHVLRPGMSIP